MISVSFSFDLISTHLKYDQIWKRTFFKAHFRLFRNCTNRLRQEGGVAANLSPPPFPQKKTNTNWSKSLVVVWSRKQKRDNSENQTKKTTNIQNFVHTFCWKRISIKYMVCSSIAYRVLYEMLSNHFKMCFSYGNNKIECICANGGSSWTSNRMKCMLKLLTTSVTVIWTIRYSYFTSIPTTVSLRYTSKIVVSLRRSERLHTHKHSSPTSKHFKFRPDEYLHIVEHTSVYLVSHFEQMSLVRNVKPKRNIPTVTKKYLWICAMLCPSYYYCSFLRLDFVLWWLKCWKSKQICRIRIEWNVSSSNANDSSNFFRK